MKSLLVPASILVVVLAFAVPRLNGSGPGDQGADGLAAGSAKLELVQGGADASGPPDEAFFFYSSGLEGLLVDPRDAGLARFLGMLDDRLLELERDLDARDFPSDLVHLLGALCERPFSFRVGPDASSGVHVALEIECGSPAAASDLNLRVLSFARQARLPVRRTQDNRHFVSTPLGDFTLGLVGGELTLSLGDVAPSLFDPAQTGLPQGASAALFARYDGVRMGQLVENVVGRNDGSMSGALYALGMAGLLGENAGVHSLAVGWTNSHGVFVARSGVPGRFVPASVDLSTLDFVPADATMASLFTTQPGMILQRVDAVGDGVGSRAREMLRAMSGVDLQTDILEKVGPTAGTYWSVGTGGGGWMSSVLFIQARDSSGLQSALAQLMQLGEAMAPGDLEGRIAQRTFDANGVRCSSLTFPGLPVPLEVSFAISNGFLYVTLSRTALTEALEQGTGRPGLLQHPRLASLDPEHLAGATHFTFVDTPFFVQKGHGTATFLAAGLTNVVRSPYDPRREPGVLVPGMGALLSNSQAYVSHGRADGSSSITSGSFDRSFVALSTAMAGSPISRSYAGIAGLGIVSSLSIPNLLSARTSANENAAIASLRSMAAAQAQLQASGAQDVDKDGAGEYGTFGELAGVVPLRAPRAAGGAGRSSSETLDPPFLSMSFGNLVGDGRGSAVVTRSGYHFQMWLPGSEVEGRVSGVAETADGRPTTGVDPDLAEVLWCCYAWPEDPGRTGQRAFFVNQEGDVLFSANERVTYGGLRSTGGRMPSFDAAYQEAGDMSSSSAAYVGGSQDGNDWTPIY